MAHLCLKWLLHLRKHLARWLPPPPPPKKMKSTLLSCKNIGKSANCFYIICFRKFQLIYAQGGLEMLLLFMLLQRKLRKNLDGSMLLFYALYMHFKLHYVAILSCSRCYNFVYEMDQLWLPWLCYYSDLSYGHGYKCLIMFACFLATIVLSVWCFFQGEIWYSGDVQGPMEMGKHQSMGIPVQAMMVRNVRVVQTLCITFYRITLHIFWAICLAI